MSAHQRALRSTESDADFQPDTASLRICEEPQESEARTTIVSQTPSIIELLRKSQRFAKSRATILITGESGTGKDLFAKFIHENSNCNQGPFGRTNCAALSPALIESELFGHERGSFTGAVEGRDGWFQVTSEGTLLLDEISEIPIELQAKLLRVLENGEFHRVGSNTLQQCNTRIIATSNRDLVHHVAEKKFRQDLYFRLNVLRIHLPPLRERAKDIPLLASHFLREFKDENEFPIEGFDAATMKVLCNYHWPGNIRQLRNAIHCACVSTESPIIRPDCLPELEENRTELPSWLINQTLEDTERSLIIAQLDRFMGNRTQVAAQLGITTRTLANKLKLYRNSGWVEPIWPNSKPDTEAGAA